MKIQSYQSFIRKNKRYEKSPILNLNRYGYSYLSDKEYESGYDVKPKVLALMIAELYGINDVVYRITTHTYGQKWIEFYGKS